MAQQWYTEIFLERSICPRLGSAHLIYPRHRVDNDGDAFGIPVATGSTSLSRHAIVR